MNIAPRILDSGPYEQTFPSLIRELHSDEFSEWRRVHLRLSASYMLVDKQRLNKRMISDE